MHLEILRALLSSYTAIPVEGHFRPDAAMIDISDALSSAFLATLRIAAPFIVFAILVNFAIGLINKLTPTIPIYFVSMPFVLRGGLLVVYFILPELLRFLLAKRLRRCAICSEDFMAQTNARNLKKLIELQKLGAARLEASLLYPIIA